MRLQLSAWHTSLCAALGLVASCGGSATREDVDADSGTGADAGSNANTGGSAGVHASTGGTAGAGAGTGATGGAAGGMSHCMDGVPIIGITGEPTGFVSCAGGSWIHRPDRRDCASILPRPGEVASPDAGYECTKDQDCAHLRNGFCQLHPGTFVSPANATCISGCIRDEDCSDGFVCLCGDPVGSCTSANCRTDAECGEFPCASSSNIDGCGVPRPSTFGCHGPGDACAGPNDCPKDNSYSCSIGNIGPWSCRQQTCGRPFLVGGMPRVAPLAARSTGWAIERSLPVGALTSATRSALAEHWSKNGLMEHASVAAFARFTLQLLSVGAPAELVRAANDALGDEITHAKLCFGLASVYAGRRIGPGPLSMQHALDDASFIDIVTTAIAEACIGETLAAAEAAEASEHAVDPDVRAALTTIARDEARHAELGWKFLRWALARTDGTTRALLVERLRALIDEAVTRVQLDAEPAHEAADAAIRLEHGVLTNALKREAHRAVLREVVRPLAHALSKASGPVTSTASA